MTHRATDLGKLLSLVVVTTAVACSGPPGGSQAADAVDTGSDVSVDVTDARDTRARDAGSDGSHDVREVGRDVGSDVDGGTTTGVPDLISTRGAQFSGRIAAGASVAVEVSAEKGDTVVIRFENTGSTAWEPALTLFRVTTGRERVAWHDPEDDSNAHIPYRDAELGNGWEFWQGGTHELVLENGASVAGEYRLVLECLSGPCKGEVLDRDSDTIPDGEDNCPATANRQQTDADGDGLGDACDPDRGKNPFASFSDAQLEQKLRRDHMPHTGVTYQDARREIFTEIDNDGGVVEAVYTGETVRTTMIPDPSAFNTEHTWPQSRGADTGDAESDLHHLFPVESTANKIRGNRYFGDVATGIDWSKGGSKAGQNANGREVFEPRDSHKGNVARAMFYFAVIYQRQIPAHEESVLRRWHQSDPVDTDERARNQAVEKVQGSRNRFVDYPSLVGNISDF